MRADLPIEVTERGNLESQIQTSVKCEVEAVSFDRGSGTNGTQIIYIVPNGSTVGKGDLLVELDTAAMKEQIETHSLHVLEARSQRLQADARYENQLTENETTKAQADLNIELAELKLKMYQDPDSGTFKLAVEQVERLIDDAKNDMLEAKAALGIAKDRKDWHRTVVQVGIQGKERAQPEPLRILEIGGWPFVCS